MLNKSPNPKKQVGRGSFSNLLCITLFSGNIFIIAFTGNDIWWENRGKTSLVLYLSLSSNSWKDAKFFFMVPVI